MGRRIDIKPLPSLERLQELLSYDEQTGVLTWKMLPTTSRSNICHNNKCGGKVAGTVGAKGYIMIGIGKVYYLAHRIIWKMMTGNDPVDSIDHEDTDRGNNRWLNLREAANGPNIWNSRLRCDNTTGVKGIHYKLGRWRAVLAGNGKQQHLGCFATKDEAAEAWRTAAEKQRGEFFRAA